MRTITRTYEVFPVTELSPQVLDKAHSDWLIRSDYPYSSDNCKTLEKFCDLFNVVCNNWEYDAYTYNFRFWTNLDDHIEQMRGQRLATYLTNNYWRSIYQRKTYWGKGAGKKRQSKIVYESSCPLTGYYIDDDILKPLIDHMTNPDPHTTFLSLIRQCLDAFFKACRDDVDECQSVDYFKEESRTNEWEYLANGKLFS